MTPLVTVVVCNYNYGPFLDEALSSVLQQSYKRIEVIVVDDGSSDNSREVLEKRSSEVTCLYTQRQGQTQALWAGVKASHGDIICLLDSDDVWFPTKVDEIVAVFNQHKDVSWVRHRLAVSDSALKSMGPSVPRFAGSRAIDGNPHQFLEKVVTVSTSALSLRRSLATRAFARLEQLLQQGAAPMSHEMLYHADAYLLTLIGTTRARGFSLDRVLGRYRRHSLQQFAGAEGVAPMLQRQIEIGRMISRMWSGETGRDCTGTHVYKHLLVLEGMQDHSKWGARRLGILLDGLTEVSKVMFRDLKLGVRQATAMLFAYVAPKTWINRLLVRQGYL